MKRPSYRAAVYWLAHNESHDDTDVHEIAGYTTVLLVADMFDVDPVKVAQDVRRLRVKAEIDEARAAKRQG